MRPPNGRKTPLRRLRRPPGALPGAPRVRGGGGGSRGGRRRRRWFPKYPGGSTQCIAGDFSCAALLRPARRVPCRKGPVSAPTPRLARGAAVPAPRGDAGKTGGAPKMGTKKKPAGRRPCRRRMGFFFVPIFRGLWSETWSKTWSKMWPGRASPRPGPARGARRRADFARVLRKRSGRARDHRVGRPRTARGPPGSRRGGGDLRVSRARGLNRWPGV